MLLLIEYDIYKIKFSILLTFSQEKWYTYIPYTCLYNEVSNLSLNLWDPMW